MLKSNPERWWCWLLVAFFFWAMQWVRAADRAPYVVEVTVLRVLASLGFQVLVIGASVFRAGVLFAEHRHRLGKDIPFVAPH